jgi:mannose PTS system EIIA component
MPRWRNRQNSEKHMIGLVLVTHGETGEAFLETMAANFPDFPQAGIKTIDSINTKTENYFAAIRSAIREVDKGQGVIVLTDDFDSESIASTVEAAQIGSLIKTEILGGINLPMMVKLGTARLQNLSFEETVAVALKAKNYITISPDKHQCG